MTIAITIGRAIGRVAATTVHGACVTASYTGQFGKDLVEGTTSGYVDNAERLAAIRAARPARAIAMTVVAAPARKTAKA